ncbi:MAG: DUF5615 family PIN-like protein [Thermoanaerobaculia bacterium]
MDENFGVRGEALLRGRGWDVATVDGQGLSSVADETLIEICRIEDRVVVSLDKDFADVVRFPPTRYRGIVVLRLPEPISLPMILNALTRVANLAETRTVIGRLWIVSINRIREYAQSE